jgi:hypothetical protein
MENTLEQEIDMLRSMLERLDGKLRFSLVLSKLSPNKTIEDKREMKRDKNYIQCAGSAKEMSIEIRIVKKGKAIQYAVGRSMRWRWGDPKVTIHWSNYVVKVYRDEVFKAKEATELFAYYLVHNKIPEKYVLRKLDLGKKAA